MMQRIRDYLGTWYDDFLSLESKYFTTQSIECPQVTLLIELFLHYFKFRLLRVCPSIIPWIQIMIWKILCDQLCQSFPTSNHSSSSLASRPYKYISLNTLKHIIKSIKSLSLRLQSTTFHSHFPLIPIKPPCLSSSFQIIIKFFEYHTIRFQGYAHQATLTNNYEELVQLGVHLMSYSRILRMKIDYGYVKAICCYQDSIKQNDNNTSMSSHCWCQEVINDDIDMVSCDKCETWYHYECVGIIYKKQIKELQSIEYICPVCVIKMNQDYRFEWPSKSRAIKRKNEPLVGNSEMKVQKIEPDRGDEIVTSK